MIPRPRAKGPGATQAPRDPETNGTKEPRDSQGPRDPDAAGTNGFSGPVDSQGPVDAQRTKDHGIPKGPRVSNKPKQTKTN